MGDLADAGWGLMPQQFASDVPLGITDTSFREGDRSGAASGLRIPDMESIAREMDPVGFHSVQVWGEATFDVATRVLFEDPWERVETLKRLMPRTPLLMLLRGQGLVGHRAYADDVVEAFVKHAADRGIDIFRIFDGLNDERNLATATRAAKEAGKHVQLALCYSVTEDGRLGGPVYTLDYYLAKARIFEEAGADSLCIEDTAGLLSPYDAQTLIAALKEQLRIPVQLHTGDTRGVAAMTVLKAIEAGVDLVWHLPFVDQRGGAPVYFAQCASGTNWRDKLGQPNLNDWKKIIDFASGPYKAFCLPFALDDKDLRWRSNSIAGLLLDRYRLLAHDAPEEEWVSEELRDRLITWLEPRVEWIMDR